MMPGPTMLILAVATTAAAFYGHRLIRVEREGSLDGWLALAGFTTNAVIVVGCLVGS